MMDKLITLGRNKLEIQMSPYKKSIISHPFAIWWDFLKSDSYWLEKNLRIITNLLFYEHKRWNGNFLTTKKKTYFKTTV